LKTIALIFPDGITLRNWIYSSFLQRAVAKYKLVIFHHVDAMVFEELPNDIRAKITFYKIGTFREFPLAKVFRYAKQRAGLLINNERDPNPTYLRNFPNYKTYPFHERLIFNLAEWFSNKPSQEKVLWLERQHHRWFDWGNKAIIQKMQHILERENVDLVFNAHQRDVKSLPIVRAARNLGLKTGNFVYSWDNLPKGRMTVYADAYLVWSPYMKAEMALYYPDISPDRVMITGTPQFEFYHTLQATSRIEFAKKHGLNPNKRWILYSGDMTDASPYDEYYLQDVYRAWKQSPDFNDTELIFRRAPMDNTGRFQKILDQCPEMVNIDPLWVSVGTHENEIAVSFQDVQMLVDLVQHCETALNFGSTMAHDFAQLGKRVWYIDYEHEANPKTWWTSKIFYSYKHFDSMEGLDPVNWIKSRGELSQAFRAQSAKNEDHIDWTARITKSPTEAVTKVLDCFDELLTNG
jgi:hypothetical protein